MSRYVILAQSNITGRALGKWLELLGEPCLGENDPQLFIEENVATLDGIRAVERYEWVLYEIEARLANCPSGSLIVLVDSVEPNLLDPLAEGGWNHLVAMLILSFPEIRWYFGVTSDYPPPAESSDNRGRALQTLWEGLRNSWIQIKKSHSLPALLAAPPRDSLFDPTSLRNFVRCISNYRFVSAYLEKAALLKSEVHSGQLQEHFKFLLPSRQRKAASIDEEVNYALFHAYTAYRFGYCTEAVRSWALMKHLFRKTESGSPEPSPGHGFDVLLEDVNLNFPDKSGDMHLSTFARYVKDGKDTGRAEHCPLLDEKEGSQFRIIVTSGHSGADAAKIDANQAFIEGYKGKSKCSFVLKPVGGMFDLWNKACLFSRLAPADGLDLAGTYPGQAPGFQWPPKPGADAEESGGHSAPGKLMLIAHHLVRRADCLKSSANTVEECIRGAVLASDALELLRYQTPTLALQALCLKHEFEVRAEVAFIGVGNHFALKPRMKELEREVRVASHFFQKDRRLAAELDALVTIGNRLMLIFREAGQFDEELECLARIRKWHRKLRIRQTDNLLMKPAQYVMYYAEWLLESPDRFLWAIIGWFLVFWLLWAKLPGLGEVPPVLNSASTAWNAFVSNNPNTAGNFRDLYLNFAATTVGIFHLGVFISFLYSAVTRK